MRRYLSGFLVLLALTACANPPAPSFAQEVPTVPPLAAGMARIYFYRDYEPYESLGRPLIFLNGQTVGISIPGGTFYRDVAPGTYPIVAWQAAGPEWRGEVKVEAGQAEQVAIELVEGKAETGHQRKDGTPYGRYK